VQAAIAAHEGCAVAVDIVRTRTNLASASEWIAKIRATAVGNVPTLLSRIALIEVLAAAEHFTGKTSKTGVGNRIAVVRCVARLHRGPAVAGG
jgi:hypothetical protein